MKVKMHRQGRYRLVPQKWVEHFMVRGWEVVNPIQETHDESVIDNKED